VLFIKSSTLGGGFGYDVDGMSEETVVDGGEKNELSSSVSKKSLL
jgi:hypothetical protein